MCLIDVQMNDFSFLPYRPYGRLRCGRRLMSEEDFAYGLEVQAPWAHKLLNGEKLIETRGYCLPSQLEGRWVFMLESREGGGQSIEDWRITGAIKFAKVIKTSTTNTEQHSTS